MDETLEVASLKGCWELKFSGSSVFTGCDGRVFGLALKASKISERKGALLQQQQKIVLLYTFSFVSHVRYRDYTVS